MYRFPRISLKSNRLVRQLKNSTFLDEYFKSVLRNIETENFSALFLCEEKRRKFLISALVTLNN